MWGDPDLKERHFLFSMQSDSISQDPPSHPVKELVGKMSQFFCHVRSFGDTRMMLQQSRAAQGVQLTSRERRKAH